MHLIFLISNQKSRVWLPILKGLAPYSLSPFFLACLLHPKSTDHLPDSPATGSHLVGGIGGGCGGEGGNKNTHVVSEGSSKQRVCPGQQQMTPPCPQPHNHGGDQVEVRKTKVRRLACQQQFRGQVGMRVVSDLGSAVGGALLVVPTLPSGTLSL